MTYRLPSLKALLAAEAVGRHGSITDASKELNVTSGAISRHVAQLEAHFGCKLFVRHPQGLALTEIGRTYVGQLSNAFGLIDQAGSRIKRKNERATLVIRGLGAYLTEWLLPRIPQFEKAHPEIALNVLGQLSGIDFDTDEADVGIVGSIEKPRHVESVKLHTVSVIPIVSADLLRKKPPIRSVDDLRHFTLLHDSHLVPRWKQWVAMVEPNATLDTTRGHWLERSSQVNRAVRQGVGVGLGQSLLIGEELALGTMVAPIDVMVTSPISVYLTWSRRGKLQSEIASFREWLIEAIRGAERAFPEFRSLPAD